MSQPSIGSIDIPNSARVYDYVLGGDHNFEPDRQAAEFMISLLPSTRKWVRMLRMFLHLAVLRLADEGYDHFLDLASGLPTAEHIHSTVPHARVVYVDNDPIVVSYGTEILGENPNTRYIQADVRNLDAILNSPTIQGLFGPNRRLAIGFNGITPFLTDDEQRQIFRRLYDWAAPGSRMFTTFETKDLALTTPKMDQFVGMFSQMGTPFYFTTPERALEVLQPWTPDENGIRPLATWLGIEDQIVAEDREGVGLEFYGVILKKE